MAKTSPGLRVTLRQPPSSLLWHPKNVGLKRNSKRLFLKYSAMQKQYSALKVENFANTMKTRTEMMARDAK